MSASSLEGSPLPRDLYEVPPDKKVEDLDKRIAIMTEDFEEEKEKKMQEFEQNIFNNDDIGDDNVDKGDTGDTIDNNFEIIPYEDEQVVDEPNAATDPNALIDLELVQGRYSPLEEFSPIYDSPRFISISPISPFKTPSPILDYSSFLKTLKDEKAKNDRSSVSIVVAALTDDISLKQSSSTANNNNDKNDTTSTDYVVTDEGVTNELFERINSGDPRLKSPSIVIELSVNSTNHDTPIIPACADIAAIPADRSPLINKNSFDLDHQPTQEDVSSNTKITAVSTSIATVVTATASTTNTISYSQVVAPTSDTALMTTTSASGNNLIVATTSTTTPVVASEEKLEGVEAMNSSQNFTDRVQNRRDSDVALMQMIEENTRMLAKIVKKDPVDQSKELHQNLPATGIQSDDNGSKVTVTEASVSEIETTEAASDATNNYKKKPKHVQFVEDEQFNRKYTTENRYDIDEYEYVGDKGEILDKALVTTDPEESDQSDRKNYFVNIMDEIEKEQESRGLKQSVTELEEFQETTENLVQKEFEELENIYKRQDSEGKLISLIKSPVKTVVVKKGLTDEVLKELATKIEERKVVDSQNQVVSNKCDQAVKNDESCKISSPPNDSLKPTIHESLEKKQDSKESNKCITLNEKAVKDDLNLKEVYDMRSFDEITREVRKELEVIRTEIQTTRRSNDPDIILEAKSDVVQGKMSKRSTERRHTTHVSIEHLQTDTLKSILKETQASLFEKDSTKEVSPTSEIGVKSPSKSKTIENLQHVSPPLVSKAKIITDIGVDEVPRRLSVIMDKPVQVLSPIQEKSPSLSPNNGSNKDISPFKSRSPSPLLTPIVPDESEERRMELQRSREKLENLIAQKQAKGEDYSTELKVDTVQDLSPRAELTAILTTPPLYKDSDFAYLDDIKSPISDHTELKLFSSYERIMTPTLKDSTNINEKLNSISKTINSINSLCRGETKYESTFKTLERMCGKKNVHSMRQEMDKKSADRILDDILSHRSTPLVTIDYADDNRNMTDYRSRIKSREISPRRRKDEEREEYESCVARHSPVRDYKSTKYDSDNFSKLDRYIYKKESEIRTNKYDYEPSYRRISPIKSDKSKICLDGLEIRHTSVTSTFYDRYLCHKREQSRLDKSPSSPMITRAYLDSLRPTPSTRVVKSAENSPSRFTYGSGLTPTKDLSPISKYDYRYDYTKSCENISSKYSSDSSYTYSSLSTVKSGSRQNSYDNINQRLRYS